MDALVGLGLRAGGAKETECSDGEDLGGFHDCFLSKVDVKLNFRLPSLPGCCDLADLECICNKSD
jgi:hypothetical protein